MSDGKKILNVSYGSFSCRLEGFDDNVATMKDIVAYFYDLAGHDDFMDVDMEEADVDALSELAENHSDGHVDIEQRDSQLRMRANPPAARDAQTADPAEDDGLYDFADPAPADYAAEYDDDDDVEGIAEEDDFADDEDDFVKDDSHDDAASYEDDSDDDESITEKLKRVRAVVDKGAPARPVQAASKPTSARPAAASNPLTQRLAELAKESAEHLQNDTADTEDAPYDDDAYDDGYDDAEYDAAPDDTPKRAYAALEEDDEDDAWDDEPLDDQENVFTQESLNIPAGARKERVRPPVGPLVLDEQAQSDDNDALDQVEYAAAEAADMPQKAPGRRNLPPSVDDAMSRIMSQADQQLNLPEGRRHRDAFAQLKAAVAATEAARQLGDEGEKTRDSEDDFKDDFGAHVAEETDNDRSEATGGPPLKLVTNQPRPKMPRATARQRRGQSQDDTSDRLKKIAALKEAGSASKDNSFKNFVASQGVKDLVDLMEASAVYITQVEAEKDFSRPQVIKKAQIASRREITREDGLRAFGHLLRQSKIVKLENGRFQVAGNSQFRPDKWRAAQG